MYRLAILFFGKHYCKQYYNPVNEIYVDIDYRHSIDNYNIYIYDYFKNIFKIIDTYLCTDDSSIVDELVSDYRPKGVVIVNDGSSHRNQKIVSVIDLCLNSNINYDIVIITRFDLLFKVKFDTIVIDYSTINIVSQLEGAAIDDNLYILPFNKLKVLQNIILHNKRSNLHWIKNALMHNFRKINYLYNEPGKIVKNLNFYTIVRSESNGDRT